MKKQIVAFIFVGSINTGFYYVLFSLFIFVGLDYKLAVLVATIIGIFFNFKTFGSFVFHNFSNKLILKFFFVYIILYFINIFFTRLFFYMYENYYISGLMSTIICAILSFLLNKYFVYKDFI
jgi:putative flippase GtrA